ncbi:MAG: patatin-like phospholipase family protein [Candidatus Krumholzibacteria bacterium]|nr:patatin-like phospholipase family protein [Candidatus Krumholzibacteria bacterium]
MALSLVPAAARESSDTGGEERRKIGLALSGGGARGAAHIGVLKILEEYRIPIDYISGTSMGAIVGGLYASGMSTGELETLISEVDWADAFVDRIPREDRSFRRKRDDDLYLVKNKPGVTPGGFQFPLGILDAQKVDLLLKKYTLPVVTVRDFDDLSIPYRAVATDIATGEAVVIGHGDLALAMRASMSIPVVFAPREIDGRLLIDGGVASNLPIDVVRRMGADVVIAVDISTPLAEREEIRSVLAATDQLLIILTRRNTDEQIAALTDDDILIRPDLGDIAASSFDRAVEAVPAGVTAAESALERLERLSVSNDIYRAHLAARARGTPAPPVIDEVRIINNSRLSDGVIAARLTIKVGQTLDVTRLERDLNQIYGLEIFESVYYDITIESDRTVLTITAREASRGPNYLQLGVAVFEDYEGPNFNVAAAFIRTPINGLGGEWRTGIQIGQEPNVFTELHQPIDHKLRKYIHLLVFAGERAMNVFDDEGRKLTEWNRRSYGGYAAFGRELGTWGDVRAGVLRESGTMKVQVGDPSLTDRDFDTGDAFVQFYVDELDDVGFPRSGGHFRVRVKAGLEALGSDAEYEQGEVDGSLAYTRGRYTGLFGGSFGTTRDSDAPLQSRFLLGGFTRLSGLEHDEIGGQHAALLYAIFYRRMWNSTLLPAYLGASVEYGNVFEERSEIAFDRGIAAGSAFFAVDTLIGPIYVGYGFAEGGRRNYYLFLGLPPSRQRSTTPILF